jgi:uncharacterized RDD family membrane protein YckC
MFIAALVQFGGLLPPHGAPPSFLWFKFALPLSWLYFTVLDSSQFQGTIGKIAFGLKVADLKGNRISFTRANIRYFGHFFSLFLLGIGFLAAAFNVRRQTMHDSIADTLVIVSDRPTAPFIPVSFTQESNTEFYYAGFWRRWRAHALDTLIISFAMTPIRLLFGWDVSLKMFLHPSMMFTSPQIQWYSFALLLVWWLYSSIMESSKKQATVGKIALSIKVVDMQGNRITFLHATGRYFGRTLSYATLFIGFMMAGWTQKKQALHDLIAETLVVRS